MPSMPEAYYDFVMDYAPNVYVIPPDTPDPSWGKAAFAAAAAMWSFANSMNNATASVQDFNEAAGETATRGRSVKRAGEDEMFRRGVE